MLEAFDDASVWEAVAEVSGGSIAAELAIFKHGGVALTFDKDGGGGVDGIVLRKLAVPIDVQIFRQRQEELDWWIYLPDASDVASASFELVYDAGPTGTAFNVLDRFTIAGPSTGWNNLGATALQNATEVGSPTDQDRRRLLAIAVRVTMNGPTDTLSGIVVDAATLSGASLLTFAGNRLLVPRFDQFEVNYQDDTIVNRAEKADEVVFVSTHVRVVIGWSRPEELKQGLDAAGLHEGLRRFAQYVKAAADWGAAKNATEIANTTVDAASGAGETDPRVLNLASTADLEFLLTDLGLTDLELLIGPNDELQYERAVVKDATYVTSGVSVTLQNALAYSYANGHRVRTLEYFPQLAVAQGGNPMVESVQNWTFRLTGEEF